MERPNRPLFRALGKDGGGFETLDTTSLTGDIVHETRPRTAADQAVELDKSLEIVLSNLADSKAEDITTIDISGKSALGDYMVIASGRSHRHVGAIADHLVRTIKRHGLGTAKVEGLPHCDWVLIDIGDIIVHLFRPEVREFYGLEKMWTTDVKSARSRA